jgi:hypothetical protein
MNRDDVLRMAQKAADETAEICVIPHEFSIRFAALVAAAEREACAKVCEERADRHADDAQYEDTEDYKERSLVYAKHVRRCAAAIRARAFVQP